MSRIVTGVNDIFTIRPDLKEYWDFEKNELDPNNTGARVNKKAWWICKKCKKSFEQVVDTRFRSTGVCSVCRNQTVVQGINDIETTHSYLLSEWDYEKNNKQGVYPTSVTYGSDKKVWWLCENGHEYMQSVNMKTTYSKGCPKCNHSLNI